MMPLRRWLLVGVLMMSAGPMAAQTIDEGEFSIRRGGREVGREQFTLRTGRGPDGNTAGTTITAVTRYPAIDPEATYATVLEQSDAGRFTVFQLEYDARDVSERYLGAQDRGRITIHRFVGDQRAAREFPGGEGAIVMVDSVFALHYAFLRLPQAPGGTATIYLARNGRRLRVRVTEEGGSLQLSGDLEARIVLDAARRIRRIDYPQSDVSVVRLED